MYLQSGIELLLILVAFALFECCKFLPSLGLRSDGYGGPVVKASLLSCLVSLIFALVVASIPSDPVEIKFLSGGDPLLHHLSRIIFSLNHFFSNLILSVVGDVWILNFVSAFASFFGFYTTLSLGLFYFDEGEEDGKQ